MDWPQVAQAIAESGAFVVALVLAIGGGIRNRKLAEENRELRKAQRDRELRQEAESVSAWVSDEWLPDHERNTYKRSVTLHVANQGSTPVFEVRLTVEVGLIEKYTIGPLAAPDVLPTLPGMSSRSWDVSIPFMAFEDTADPRVAVSFTTQSGTRWARETNGRLVKDPERGVARWAPDGELEEATKQIGRLDTLANPMGVAFAFLHVVTEDPENINRRDLYQVTAPEATGWKGASDDDLAELGRKLARYGPATFVNYPAPQVAYVRIPLVEPDETDDVVAKDGEFLPAQILTLTFSYDRGWRVYQVGPSLPPDVLRFARKTF
jgi:hypothetical protein